MPDAPREDVTTPDGGDARGLVHRSPEGLLHGLLPLAPGHRPAPRGLRPAAVLVPLLAPAGAPLSMAELLFLVRPEAMSSHAGQVAFPGGRVDAEDADVAAAALRETEEELGIPRARPRVLGALPDVAAPSGYLITPVVALVETPVQIVPSPAEVAHHFSVPLSRLADPRLRRTIRGVRGGGPQRSLTPIHFWVDTPAVIWGVTGHILDRFLAIVDGRA